MVDHRTKNERMTLIMMCLFVSVCFAGGVIQGLHENWMRSALSLFVAGFMTQGIGLFLLHFALRRLEDRLLRDLDVSRKSRMAIFLGNVLVLSTAVLMALAVISTIRQDAFGLSIYLAACAIISILCTNAGFAARI